MSLRTRTLLLIVSAAAVTLPNAATATCSSTLPVTDPHAAGYSCTHASPGMLLKVPSQKYGSMSCTAGFAFTDQFKQRYLTFPGRCFLDYDCLEDAVVEELPPPLPSILPPLPTCLLESDSELEPVYKRGGPVVKDAAGKRVGVIVYAVNKDGVNLALLRVDAGVPFSPQLPFYGGPTKWGTASASFEEAYVFSAATGVTSVNARSGLLHGAGTVAYHLAEPFTSVAAGSPVMKPDGSAIGYYSGMISVYGNEVLTYDKGLHRAEHRTKLALRLMTG